MAPPAPALPSSPTSSSPPARLRLSPLVWGLPCVMILALALLRVSGIEPALTLALNHALLGLAPAQPHQSLPPILNWHDAPALTVALASWWSCLSVLGLGLSMLLVLLARPLRNDTRMAAFLLCLVVGGVATHAVKRLVEAPRPAAVLGDQGLQVVGQTLRQHAMTSGHAATAFAAAALLSLASRAGRAGKLATAVWLWVATCIALSRVAVGAHWPSDVLAGAALGWVCGCVSVWLAVHSGLDRWCATTRGQWLMVLMRVGGGLALCVLNTGYPLGVPLQGALGIWSIASGMWDLKALLQAQPHPSGGSSAAGR